ncbi:DUF2945 domain-containing protein [Novosphingobium sp. BL-52-GroH]|uniref:DUF2945 domain-containing protein n=1 Tax=Novosphingobium sp. BL-52-GroH TaxID=3349877 RepID=UPI00384CEF2E
MTARLRKGARVRWNWGQGSADGRIAERFERRVTRTIAGKRIARNGTPDNPAYLIEQDDGSRVLKRGSELEHA